MKWAPLKPFQTRPGGSGVRGAGRQPARAPNVLAPRLGRHPGPDPFPHRASSTFPACRRAEQRPGCATPTSRLSRAVARRSGEPRARGPHGHRLRRLVRHGPGDRRGARRGRRERDDVRPPPRVLDRERAARRPRRTRRPEEPEAPRHARRDRTLEAFGGLDILVLNGGGPPRTRAADVTPEAIEDAVELLLTPSVRLVGLALPHLRESGHGPHRRRHVEPGARADRQPRAPNAIRPGLVGWLKTLARELGPDGVTVNVIAPGRIDTDRLREVYPDGPTDDDLAAIALRRIGDPSEIGDVVSFLASDRALRHRRRPAGRRRPDPRAPVVRLPRALVGAGLGLLAVGVLWFLSSSSFLVPPDRAKPLERLVDIDGERPAVPAASTTWTCSSASLLERIVSPIRPEGAGASSRSTQSARRAATITSAGRSRSGRWRARRRLRRPWRSTSSATRSRQSRTA